jgi:hypothetical protein
MYPLNGCKCQDRAHARLEFIVGKPPCETAGDVHMLVGEGRQSDSEG